MKYVKNLIKYVVLGSILVYQKITPYLNSILHSVFGFASSCKYEEHCSDYTIRCIHKHGTMRGILLGIQRITSCHG